MARLASFRIEMPVQEAHLVATVREERVGKIGDLASTDVTASKTLLDLCCLLADERVLVENDARAPDFGLHEVGEMTLFDTEVLPQALRKLRPHRTDLGRRRVPNDGSGERSEVALEHRMVIDEAIGRARGRRRRRGAGHFVAGNCNTHALAFRWGFPTPRRETRKSCIRPAIAAARAPGMCAAAGHAMTLARMHAEDTAWMRIAAPDNPMVVSAMLTLRTRWSLERARAVLAALGDVPAFRARVVDGHGQPGAARHRMFWSTSSRSFDVGPHVEEAHLDADSDADLRTFIEDASAVPLDRRLPLWHVWLVQRPNRGTVLFCRVHHAIGDGFALLDVLRALCSSESAAFHEHVPVSAKHRPPLGVLSASARTLANIALRRSEPPTPLRSAVHARRRMTWTTPLPLAKVTAAARATSASVNDVVVALTTGGLARVLDRQGVRSDTLEIHALVPIDLRPHGTAPITGNDLGFVLLGLPLGVRDPVARVTAVKLRMHELKDSPEPRMTKRAARMLAAAPASACAAATSFVHARASLVLANVVGSPTPLALDGIPVDGITFWPPAFARLGLGVGITSYAGVVTIGIVADAGVLADPGVLAAAMEAETAALFGSLPRIPELPNLSR